MDNPASKKCPYPLQWPLFQQKIEGLIRSKKNLIVSIQSLEFNTHKLLTRVRRLSGDLCLGLADLARSTTKSELLALLSFSEH